MAIPPSGTFNYTGVVPDDPHSSRSWRLRDESGAASSARGGSLSDNRLVGLSPSLEIVAAGLTPDVRVSPYTGNVRPKVMLSRLILRAESKDRATVAAFAFCVDEALPKSFCCGDVLHLARTSSGGLGLSLIRGGRLIAAVGAVTEVPHGESVKVRFPGEVIRDAQRVFTAVDPQFEFRELPIELCVDSERRILYRGRPRIGDYEVFVEHGFYRGLPGTDECVALSRVSDFPSTPAICSAQLLE